MYIPRLTHPEPRPSKGLDQRCLAPYAWLAAGVLVLGGAAALAEGAGVAHADATASSDSAHSAGPAHRSPGRNADHRPRAAATSAKPGSTTAVRGLQRAALTAAAATSASAAAPTHPGLALFSYTGAPQTWQVPAGVQSADVGVQGGFGGPCGVTRCSSTYESPTQGAYPATVRATVTLSGGNTPAITALNIVVGGGGAGTDGTAGGAGGYGGTNGGAAGGSGSSVLTTGAGGAGGGGATTVYVVTGGVQAVDPAIVAGGGGGSGGSNITQGQGGGNGGSAIVHPSAASTWPGNNGFPGQGEAGDGGDGGQAGLIAAPGQPGGDAESGSDNAGGGGGGGGYLGGGGGQAGQTDSFSARPGAGGGGGSGSSYASNQWTFDAYAAPARQPEPFTPVGENGIAIVKWVSIDTTALAPLTLGQSTSQHLQAYYGGYPGGTEWQVSGGALPAGLTLSPFGVLSGTPTKLGKFSYQATVSSALTPSVNSVMTYSGHVTAPTFRQVLENIVLGWGDFIAQRPPCHRELRAG